MEPGTPQPVIRHGASAYPLAWTKRSEAIISRHGHDVLSLLDAMRKRRTGLYALCLGLHAALPPARAPETPEEIADWLGDDSGQAAAATALMAVIRHAYPAAAEKKSGSTP
jgi:hypothetical protein